MILSSVIPASCAVIVVVDTRNREVDTGRRSRCGIAQVNRTWIAAADGAVSRYAAELEHVKCCDHSNLGVWFSAKLSDCFSETPGISAHRHVGAVRPRVPSNC